MTLLTKGMGAVIKGIKKTRSPKGFGKRNPSKLTEKGYKVVIGQRYTPEGDIRKQKKMVGPLKGFNIKPKMPKTKTGKGQGVLFTEKYQTMPKDPNALPGQLKFNFKRKGITGRYNRKTKDMPKKLKTLIKKAEIK